MTRPIFLLSIICIISLLVISCEEISTPSQTEPPISGPSGISLELSTGTIDFRENIYEYRITVPDNIRSLTITPTYNEEIRMQINNLWVKSGETSESLPLQFGVDNIINIDLIRVDSWDSHYVIKVRINSLKRQTVTYDYVTNTDDRQDIYDYNEERLNLFFARFRTGTGNLETINQYVYNADRQLISIHSFNGGVNNYNYFKFYNDDGLLLDYKCYDAAGALYWVYHYEYVNQQLTRYTRTYASGTIYTYDQEFNDLGQCERIICYMNGNFSYAGVYSYNSEGKTTVYTHYSNQSETVIAYILSYDYNEIGYMSKVIQSRTTNNYTATYEYEFYEF